MMTEHGFQLDYAVHPGEYLAELLEACNMSQKELADRTDISTKHINLIINGKVNMTAKTAIALESALQRPAHYWLDLQTKYDEFCERQERLENLQKNIAWIGLFDYRELADRKLVEPTRDVIQKGMNLLAFFQVASVEAWHNTWHANANDIYCRSGAQTGIDVQERTIARLAQWIRVGQIAAEERVAAYPPFSAATLEKSLQRIRDLNMLADARELVLRLSEELKRAGVLIQFIREIAGMRTYGTSFMTRNNEVAVIQLCLRGRTNDQLWFTLLHEIWHLLCRGNNRGFLIGHSKDEAEERKADEFAQNMLVQKANYQAFISAGVYSAQTIISFAQENHVHAGIVVGRLQHERKIAFNALNHLKVRYEWIEKADPA